MPQDDSSSNTHEAERSAIKRPHFSSVLIFIAVLVLIGGGAFAGYVAFPSKTPTKNLTTAKPPAEFCATDSYKESLDCRPIDQSDCLLIQELYNHFQNYTFDKEKLTMVHLEQWFSQCQSQEQAKINSYTRSEVECAYDQACLHNKLQFNGKNNHSLAEEVKCPAGQIFDGDVQECIPDNTLDEKIRTAYDDKMWDQYLQLNFQKLEESQLGASLTDKLKLKILFARDFYKKYQVENLKDQKSLTQIKQQIEKLQDIFIKNCPDTRETEESTAHSSVVETKTTMCFDVVKACADIQNLYIEAREGSPYKKTGIAGFAMTRYQKATNITTPTANTPPSGSPGSNSTTTNSSSSTNDQSYAASDLNQLTFDQFFEQADFYKKYCLKPPIQN